MGTPLKNQNFENPFCACQGGQKKAQSQIFMNLGPQMADITMDNKSANFNTGPYGDPP